ncbi:MAG: bifunctional phosphopantothenoylcysteine decarboxylase/phosphopantothenate--cysteine ligase CoaBC [Siphonobacter sp.]
MLSGKRIILGVTGSIAAYKAALLVRLLVKAGAEVQVIMTSAAHDFITPLTLSTLSKRPVLTDFATADGTGTWNNHVALALWADLILIAPATAHTLAKAAHGLCDDLLLAVYLSAKCPVFWAPAMDLDMYRHGSTKANLKTLESYGNEISKAESGELASGLVGEGRMSEPEHLVQRLSDYFKQSRQWAGIRVLVTAGPTQEALDPVRYLSNHSTGKMGYALARQLALAGAHVTIVSGPTALGLPHPAVHRISVTSAQEMYEASEAIFADQDLIILAAAVADYTPVEVASQKIKKKTPVFNIELKKTVDIAATLGQRKRPDQLLVGFALETENGLENAKAKLLSKNLDLIVLNTLADPGAGFGHDTNKITILDKTGQCLAFELKAKDKVAEDILQTIIPLLHKK